MGKVVLITGASRGIGAAIAQQMAREGYQVVVNYCRHEEQAFQLANKMNAYSCPFHLNNVLPIQADVQNRVQVEAMFQKIQETFGHGVDILVNNAGISQQKLFTDITEADWDTMFGVNVKGIFHCCQCALPYMIHQKSGKIINISSMWGQVGASCEVHYSAAKAAVIGMTKALAKELGPSHIQVNCIAPGVIQTEMNAHLSDSVLQDLKNETPLEVLGRPEDIAKSVSFLASSDSDFITGQVLGVNGGFVIS